MEITDTQREVVNTVVEQFLSLQQATPREKLVRQFRNVEALTILGRHRFFYLVQEGYVPLPLAFEYCGNKNSSMRARQATELVLRILQSLWETHPKKKEAFTFQEFLHHAAEMFDSLPDQTVLTLGLSQAGHFNIFYQVNGRLDKPGDHTSFIFHEGIATINPATAWDEYLMPIPLDSPKPGIKTNSGSKIEHRSGIRPSSISSETTVSQTDQQTKPKAEDFLTPASFIRAAKAAHPAFRYAIAVAGVFAIVVTIVKFGAGLLTLAFGAIAIIGVMVLFLLFAQASKLTRANLDRPAQVLVWAMLVIAIIIVLLLAGSVFFNWPLPFRDWIVAQLAKQPNISATKPSSTEQNLKPPEDHTSSPPNPPGNTQQTQPWNLIHVTKNVPVTLLSNGTISAVYEDLGNSVTLSIQTPRNVFPSIDVDVNGNGVLDPGLDYLLCDNANGPALQWVLARTRFQHRMWEVYFVWQPKVQFSQYI